MRVVLPALALMILPPTAQAQSLGGYNPVSAPVARSSEWGGARSTPSRSTPPRGGFRIEPVGEAPADLGFQREAAKVRRDIRNAERSGQISRREALAFRREIGSTSGYARRSGSSGSLSYAAASQSRSRLEGVRGRLFAARTPGIGNAQPR